MFEFSDARRRFDKFVFFFVFLIDVTSSNYLEFIKRDCLPTGNWSIVSYESCVYIDVWELMMTFYIKRTPGERKVCLDKELIFQSKRVL